MEQWNDTMAMLEWKAPGYKYLWYKLLAERSNSGKSQHIGIMTTENNPNASTDGCNIMFNPDWFFALKLQERVFVAAHEVQHNVYNDITLLHQCVSSGKVPMPDGTSLPFDMMTMQKAMDYRINALLIASKIGTPPAEGNFDPKTGPNDSVYDTYAR